MTLRGSVNEVSRALLSAIPVPRPQAKRSRIVLQGEMPSALDPPSGCCFHPRCAFAMERCPTVATGIGATVRAELAALAELGKTGMISGSDRDAGAIAGAISNAERAGVASDLSLAVHALSAVRFPEDRGWVVTNPPYGVRVGDADRVRDLWAQLGNVLRERAGGWQVALLSPDPALDRQLRLPLKAVASTSNGGIPVRIMVGEVRG